VGADNLRDQFLVTLDGLSQYVRITGDAAGAENLRRSLLAALDLLAAL
jgi:hypothetical protein